MSDESFHPRVVPPAAEADRPTTGSEPSPEADESGGSSAVNAPTLPLPPRRTPAQSDPPAENSAEQNGAAGRRSYGDGTWVREDDGEQRIKPAIPVAQLRRALDSFYATHSNDSDTEDEAGAKPAKVSPLPSRKRKDKSAGKERAAAAQTGPSTIPGPRAGGRSTTGSVAQRPLSSPAARPVSAEPATATEAAPAAASKSPDPSDTDVVSGPIAPATAVKAEKAPRPPKAPKPPKAEKPAAEPKAQPRRRRAIRLSARPSLRWWLLAIVLALVLAASAAVLGANLGSRKAPPAAAPAPTIAAPGVASGPAVSAAVSWIIHNVGPEHVVACDVAVCGLLRSQGFPASSLITVRTGIADIEQADVVVETALLRQLAGPRLSTVEASQPLAVFGTDAQLAIVQTVALVGPTEYGQQLAADLASRTQAGLALVHNPRLTLSPAAQQQLSAGRVDSRICSLLALLVGGHSITVAAFTPPGPGAGPSIPSAGVVISTIDGLPATGASPAAAALKSLVSAQQAPFEPLSVGPAGIVAEVEQPTAGATPNAPGPGSGAGSAPGAGGLEIIYAQPGPLGLLGGGTQ